MVRANPANRTTQPTPHRGMSKLKGHIGGNQTGENRNRGSGDGGR